MIVRSSRALPMKVIAQCTTVVTRFLKPVRKARWTTSHASQPIRPEKPKRPKAATAEVRETAAIVPRSW